MTATVKSVRRGASFWLLAIAALIGIGCAIYYTVQSNADNCFNLAFLLVMLGGVIVGCLNTVHPMAFFAPLEASLFGVGFGIMVNNMLPTLSDVWNGIVFIGGNLTAYLIYTVLALVCTVLTVIACCKVE